MLNFFEHFIFEQRFSAHKIIDDKPDDWQENQDQNISDRFAGISVFAKNGDKNADVNPD